MNTKLQLTLAAGDYESIRALKEGIVKPDGIELTILTDMTAEVRHARMLRGRQFDVAELSMSNYLVAKDNGLPFIAIPVFLHRRFRHGFAFVNTTKGINKPTDLIGKKIGVGSYHATSNLWLRGILEHDFDLPHNQIHWFKEEEEKIPWQSPPGLSIQKTPAGKNIVDMLLAGELDAVIDPEVIRPIATKDPRVRRLISQLSRLGNRLLQTHRHLPDHAHYGNQTRDRRQVPLGADESDASLREIKKDFLQTHGEPENRPLAWFRSFVEEQEEIFAGDPWIYGLGDANRKNIETLMQYSHEQGLIGRKMAMEELFIDTGNSVISNIWWCRARNEASKNTYCRV